MTPPETLAQIAKKLKNYQATKSKCNKQKSKQKSKEKDEQKKFANTLIFSANGDTPISNRAIAYHFDKIIKLAKIENIEKRNIVPYSFRHYYITQKVNSGLVPTSVGEIAGTSTTQIENTYYHTTDAKLITNAFAGYVIKDGLLIPT